MKKFIIILSLVCISGIATAQSFSDYAYAYSDSIFNNPERGFYKYTERSNSNATLDLNTLVNYRNLGYTLIYRIFYLRDFVNSPISESYLDKIKDDFNKMREAGIKGVIRFAYTSSMSAPYGDATPERVFSHIEQLKSILTDNSDVIFILQAGFVGAWGEWYYTDHFATGSPSNVTDEDMAERKELIDKLLDAIPKDRMIQVRYVGYKMKFFDDTPVSLEEAYSGSPKSRISHHNDCFVSSQNDVGSYQNIKVEKKYLEQDTKYTSIGGETCDWYPSRSNCDTTTSEMERFHWSFINQDYYGLTLSEWKESGCFDEIFKKLGYRYYLIDAGIQNSSKQNGSFDITFRMKNIGYSNPVNPRNIEIVIRNKATGKLYYSRINTEIRKEELNTVLDYAVQIGIPSFVPDGEYEVFLNLPDCRSTLRYNPNYSIRLANEGIWNKTLGMNSLKHTLHINKDAKCSEYSGNNYFISYSDNQSTSIQIDGAANDWNPIPASYSESSVVKICDYHDTIFFMLNGSGLTNNYRLFLDTDANSNTGMNSGTWTNGSGIDYLIQDNGFFNYIADKGDWNSFSSNVLTAANDSVVEIAVPKNIFTFTELGNIIRLGIKIASDDELNERFIPAQSDNLIVCQLTSSINAPKLYITSYCQNAIVSVAPEESDTASFILVERSKNLNEGYSNLATLGGLSGTLYFKDNQLNDNSEYYYRAKRMTGTNYSLYSNTQSVTSEECSYKYPSITVDANENDWNAIAPINAIAYRDMAFYFKAYTDDSYLNLLLRGDSVVHPDVYIDTDNNPLTGEKNQNWETSGFDYKYSLGSLYQYKSGEYTKVAQIDSVKFNTQVWEAKIPLYMLDIDNTKTILNYAEQFNLNSNTLYMPFNSRKSSLYERILPPEKPHGFSGLNSVNSPSCKLIVTWDKCTDCEGYLLTRVNKPNDDSSYFDLQVSENQLIDGGLDARTSYEYFLYSYNFGGKSETTDHIILKTEVVTGINDQAINSSNILIWPVPAKDNIHVKYLTTKNDGVSILEIYTMEGKLLYKEKSNTSDATNSKTITIPVKNLSAGIYLLSITAGEKNFIQKFIKK